MVKLQMMRLTKEVQKLRLPSEPETLKETKFYAFQQTQILAIVLLLIFASNSSSRS